MARPTKYTPETANRVLEGIRLGMTWRHAAAYAGVSVLTIRRWCQRYADFGRQLEEAEGHAVAANMERIRQAALNGDWRASAWILERRWPEDYGARQRVDQTITVDVRKAAEKAAAELGVPVDVVLAEAYRLAEDSDDGGDHHA